MPPRGRDTESPVGSYLPPPHRLSSIDDPYALTLTHTPSPRHSSASLDYSRSPSPHAYRDSYTRVEHTDADPDNPAMPLSQGHGGQQGYANVNARPSYSNNAFNSSAWLEKEQSRSRRSKWIVIGTVTAIIALIIVGVAVGVTVAKSHKSSGSKSSSSNAVTQTDPNDPSSFVLDSRLKKSFFALAYTPENSQYPACGNNLQDVITDIQLMSQLTSQIRLYGADCNQTELVLEAIKQTKVDMQVWLGNYPTADDPAPYERQRDAIIAAIQKYGTDHIAGISVGNEFILNWVIDHNSDDPNSPAGNAGAQLLLANITDTRQAVAALNLPKKIPIGTADAGSFFNTQVLQSVDFGMSNIHAWFANQSIADAAGWVADFFQTTNVAAAAALSNNPTMYIAETGWPTASKDAGNESNGPSTASEANLQTFLDTWVCQANANNTGYFFFEYFDETWKDEQFGGVEGHWGLFYSNRTLKDITIPTCN